jgi:hypothetical protein
MSGLVRQKNAIKSKCGALTGKTPEDDASVTLFPNARAAKLERFHVEAKFFIEMKGITKC